MHDKLKQLRIEKGLTQKQVADYLGCSTRAYGHYEAGEREPTFDFFKKLCLLFEVSADYLLGLSDI